MNLVKNAIKFTFNGTILIKIGYDSQNQMLRGQVIDTGVGIAHEDLPKLFNRFGKLLRTAEMNHDGIGLGLSITKTIVEKSGGEIFLSSPGLGKGTQVTFSMKVQEVSDEIDEEDWKTKSSYEPVNFEKKLEEEEKEGFFLLREPKHQAQSSRLIKEEKAEKELHVIRESQSKREEGKVELNEVQFVLNESSQADMKSLVSSPDFMKRYFSTP